MNTKLGFVAPAKFALGMSMVIFQYQTGVAQSSRLLGAPLPAYYSGQTSQPGLSTSIQSTTPALSPVGRHEVAATPVVVLVQSGSAERPNSPPAESNIREVYDGLPIQNRQATVAQPQSRRAEQVAPTQFRRAIDSRTTPAETTIRRSNPNRPQANARQELELKRPDANSSAKGERDQGEVDEMENEGKDDDEDDDEDQIQEHLEIVDRLFESATVKRLMSLMEENMELRANLRIQQVEKEAQMQLMELKVNQRLEQAELKVKQRLEQAELKLQQHSQKNDDPIIEKLTDALRQAESGQAAAERRAESMERRLKELQERMEQMARSTAEQRENAKRDREQADAPKKKPSPTK